MKTTFAITIMKFKELKRNFKSSAIVFILPMVFIAIFAIIFGGSGTSINFDLGIIQSEKTLTLEHVLSEAKHRNGENIFSIKLFEDYAVGAEELKKENIDLLIENNGEKFALQVNPLNQYSSIVSNVITDVIEQINGVDNSQFYEVTQIELDNFDTDNFSAFQYIAIGLIIYGLLILIPQVAHDFAKIKNYGLIFRYSTSKVNSLEIILGHYFYLLIIGIIQLFILFGVALLFGFQISGNPLLAILIVGIPTVSFAVAIGLLIGAFIKNADTATNVGTLFSIILGFFSGAFADNVDTATEISIAGKSISLAELIPSFHSTEALRSILIHGSSLNDVSHHVLFLVVSSTILLFLSIIMFSKRQLNLD